MLTIRQLAYVVTIGPYGHITREGATSQELLIAYHYFAAARIMTAMNYGTTGPNTLFLQAFLLHSFVVLAATNGEPAPGIPLLFERTIIVRTTDFPDPTSLIPSNKTNGCISRLPRMSPPESRVADLSALAYDYRVRRTAHAIRHCASRISRFPSCFFDCSLAPSGQTPPFFTIGKAVRIFTAHA